MTLAPCPRTTTLLVAILVTLAGGASLAKNVHIDPSAPRATGQENVDFTVKDQDGVTHHAEVRTADVPDGTDPQQAADQGGIVKGQTDDQKAQAIAHAINNDPEASSYVTAVAIAGEVVVAPKPAFDFETISVTHSDTKEDIKVRFGDTNDIVYTLPANDLLLATVRFTGTVAGVGFDGSPGTVRAGTMRYVAEVPTAGYRRVSDLLRAVAEDLRSHGVRARLVLPDTIVILLDPDLDDHVRTDTNDRGLVQHVALGDI